MIINIVADLFSKDYAGGAELTTEAILENCPQGIKLDRHYSRSLNSSLIQSKKSEKWIFGNFAGVEEQFLLEFAKSGIDYSVIEYDYKFCSHRSAILHELSSGTPCDCETKMRGKIVSAFLAKSRNIFWMSEEQKTLYHQRFPYLSKTNNHILSSVFSGRDLSYIRELKRVTKEKNNKYIILGSSSPVKNREGCIEFAKKNGLDYEVVSGLPYFVFLRKLASSRGLIFLPLSEDTCPRLVIEASLLGLDIKLNNLVQHQNEQWYDTEDSILEYLKSRATFFWDKINE
jgi:hypothetical protein